MSVNESNTGKLSLLDRMMAESLRVMNEYINQLWDSKERFNKFADVAVDTWLSARMKQCLLKQSVEAMKSQRKRKKQIKPVITAQTLNLDQRFVKFEEDVNSFDFWFHLSSLGDKIILDLPSKKHKHLNSYLSKGWRLRRGCRLGKTDRGWFIDLYVEKEKPSCKLTGKVLGIDVGYKKLIACSNGQIYDEGMEGVYNKLSRKRQGSKAFKRALVERDCKINASVNRIGLSEVQSVVVEDLKNVKRGSKGKIRKRFTNKLQRWSYPKVLDKLERICEEGGVSFVKVDPAYTSQTCSNCGLRDKTSRKGEVFCCVGCGMLMDADINASINILQRGVYSLPPVGIP